MGILKTAKPSVPPVDWMGLDVDSAYREWNEARNALYQAQHNFEHAQGAHIDLAINDLRNAEARVDNAFRKLRQSQLDTFESWTDENLQKAIDEKWYGHNHETYLIAQVIEQRKGAVDNGRLS